MDGYRLTGADIAALVIFVSALVTRAVMQAITPNGEMPDLSWITTFAAIAAAWLSLGSRTRDVHTEATKAKEMAEKTEHNTNGELTAKLESMKAEIIDVMKAHGDEIYQQQRDDESRVG